MFKESCRVLVAALALALCASAARADTVNVTGSCLGCMGDVSGGRVTAFGMISSTGSDLSSLPGIQAEFRSDMPWFLDLNPGSFSIMSSDGNLRISGRVTEFDFTSSPLLHQPLVYFWTVTDSAQWIDGTGQTIQMPQTGTPGRGVTGGRWYVNGVFDFGFDLPEAPAVPEPATLLLLSAGLLALAPWVRRHK